MLPVSKLPIDVKGLTPEMHEELEKRVLEFERDHEASVSQGGEGYVPLIRKGDFVFAGVFNAIIVVYFIIAVLVM
jgi:hypothetical protein